MIRSFRRALAVVLASLTLTAHAATDYTDSWWAAGGSEGGWGLNLTHQVNFIFATFFVYGVDGKATWFTAQMSREGGTERFSGGLFRFTGTWYGAPVWNGNSGAQAGTASFVATSAQAGTLEYTVDGLKITKTIERLRLADINLTGIYIGGVSARRSGCEASGTIIDPIQYDIRHETPDGTLRIDQISTSSGALICRMEGRTVQYGKVVLASSADYSCVDGWSSKARLFNLRRTTTGFEGQWFADAGDGCTESGNLAGVTQSP